MDKRTLLTNLRELILYDIIEGIVDVNSKKWLAVRIREDKFDDFHFIATGEINDSVRKRRFDETLQRLIKEYREGQTAKGVEEIEVPPLPP